MDGEDNGRLDQQGVYTAKSAYSNLFAGRLIDPLGGTVWRSRAPMRCRFFGWLAVRNRCWTGDRLQQRGLSHPARCPLCDQEPETVSHLLLGCVVTRQVWEPILALWGHLDWRPEGDSDIRKWWATAAVPQGARRDFRTATALVFWSI